MKQIIVLGVLSLLLSGCSHWSNQMERSPCACDFVPLTSRGLA